MTRTPPKRPRARKPTAPSADASRIELMPLSELQKLSAKRNPKGHDVASIARSIETYGFNSPPVLNETTGRLVAGHGRVAALVLMQAERKPAPARVQATKTGWLVPVLRGVSFASEQEAEEFLLADNRLVEVGGWELPDLSGILGELAERGRLEHVGWSADDLAEMLAGLRPATPPDDFPAVDENVPTEHECPKCKYRWSGGK